MSFPGLGSWVERRALRTPDDVALVVGDRARSYREFAGSVRAIAEVLRGRGIGPGDRVAFHGSNHPVALGSLFATAALGAIWVPVHPARPDDEVRHVLRDAEARLLVRAAADTHPDVGLPELDADELDALPPPSGPLSEVGVDPDDLVVLAYTSGTTGAPKGVMLSHTNLTWNVIHMLTACGFGPGDVTVASAPLTRMGGLGVTVLPALFAGGSVVIAEATDGSALLQTIERARVSVLFANPDLLEAMVRAPGWAGADLSSVRTAVVGGGLVPEALLRAYLERGVSLRHGYGLTEASPVVSLLDDAEAGSRASSVGRPMPFVDVRVMGPDGTACDVGEIGEVQIRGPNVSAGYWRSPPVHDPDGWFPTGDAGSIDADGYLTIVDRLGDAIVCGGVRIFPAEIERVLLAMPSVREAAVAVVDGHLVAAVVVDRGEGDPDRLLAIARDSLPPPKVPGRIRLVEAIPRNASGKVRREALRLMLAASLSAAAAADAAGPAAARQDSG